MPQRGRNRRLLHGPMVTVAAVVIAAIAAAILFSFRFVEDERERSLQSWQIRLGIVADSRAAAVHEWLDSSFEALRSLAENASLQLYVSQLAGVGGDRRSVVDEPAQASYLRNLLVATADRAGFVPPPSAGDIAANVDKTGTAGIGLVDINGQTLVATPHMPPLSDHMRDAVFAAFSGTPAIVDMYRGTSGLPTLGFVLPVYAIQDDRARAIAAVVGVRIVDDGLFARLRQPGDTSDTSETFLVRQRDRSVDYLSPLADGAGPLERSLSDDTPELAAAVALRLPGRFTLARNYAGRDVLAVSRPLAGVPWVLVRTIDRAEALAASDRRLDSTLIVLLLIIAAVTLTVAAVWRHGSSLRAARAAEEYRVTAERFANIGKFLRVVTNAQSTRIVAVDAMGCYTFANERAAEDAGIAAEDMIGKSMASVIGPAKANVFTAINRSVQLAFLDNDDVDACRQTHVHTFAVDGDPTADAERVTQVIRSEHIPLRGDRDYPPAVLMVLDDITPLVRERRHSEVMLNRLVDTLVSVVDRRHPDFSHHSLRVARVCRTIATGMNLPEADMRVLDIAGRLSNLGKLFVPTELLAKHDALSEEERQMLSDSHRVSADLVRDVPFEGPVVQTIEQMGEWWNGTGPLGRSSDDILPTARILAVANAFVALTSRRPYRAAMTATEAASVLLHQAGSKFDRKPALALVAVLESQADVDGLGDGLDTEAGIADAVAASHRKSA